MQRELHEKLATGYTRLPNTLLMSMLVGDLGKNEVRLLLLIARLTISFDREFVKLSKTVVKRYTGMQGRSMLDAFAVLEERKLIRKVTGDHKSPNQYALTTEITTAGPNPGSKRTQVQNAPQVQKGTQGWVQNEPPRKDNLEIYKNSLSQEPAVIREYFARAMPCRKRESELKAFEELKRDYSAQDVAEALACLQRGRSGANGTALVYHSPMAYLAKAMGEVMAEVQKQRQERAAAATRTAREVEARRQQLADEAREAALVAEQERAFAMAYPDEAQQREVLTQLLKGTPFKPESRMGRIMALGKWWEAKTA
jgi:phage replication O-like protein O